MNDQLSDEARKLLLEPLLANGWVEVEGRDAITKMFEFRNFVEAFGWMTRVALWSEKWNHHPEWHNVYNTVEVVLITHDLDGFSALDAKLARKMDGLV